MPPLVLAPVRPIVRAVAVTVVPDAARLDEAAWLEMEMLIEDALAERPAALRHQLLLFVRALQVLPIVRYGRPFTRLPQETRTRFLAALERAPVLAIRRGVWGLRTLLYLGFYSRPAEAAAIGYHADPRGWEARR